MVGLLVFMRTLIGAGEVGKYFLPNMGERQEIFLHL